MVLLTAGTLLPLVVFCAVVVLQLDEDYRRSEQRRLIRSASDLAVTIDRELADGLRSLETLALSPRLERGDMERFADEAARVAALRPYWKGINLVGVDRRIVASTFGQTPGETRLVDTESVDLTFETGLPQVGTIRPGPAGNAAFALRVPVIRDGRTAYVLSAVVTPDALMSLLGTYNATSSEWTRTISDKNGIVAARSRSPEQFIGRPATPWYVYNINRATEGVFESVSLDNRRVFVAFSRAPESGWTASIVVPRETLIGAANRSLMKVTLAGLSALGLSIVGALVLSRHMGRNIDDAAESARALARGQPPSTNSSTITEIDQLNRSLRQAYELLRQREQQRSESLERAQAALQAAEAASAAKDHFLAVLSHELRTPLSPVLMNVELLQSTPSLPPEAADALRTIRRNVMLEARLIDDLLDISRITSGKIRLEHRTIDVHDVIRDALHLVEADMRSKQIDLQTQLTASRSTVEGDATRLHQVIGNLLANAVKFTPSGGRITIRTADGGTLSQPSGRVTIVVEDTGVGIEPEMLSRIFEAFEQVESASARQFGGLGLGLAIARALVELHGGQIKAESEGAGRGSRFTIELPVYAAQQTSRTPFNGIDARVPGAPPGHGNGSGRIVAEHKTSDATALLPAPAAGREKKRGAVLLVDDHLDTLMAMRRVLQRMGLEVSVAESAEVALSLADQRRFDLIVSDVGLPGLSGHEMMRQLKARGVAEGIAVSGFGTDKDLRQSHEAGFAMHLTKPIDIEQLRSAVLTLLDRWHKPEHAPASSDNPGDKPGHAPSAMTAEHASAPPVSRHHGADDPPTNHPGDSQKPAGHSSASGAP